MCHPTYIGVASRKAEKNSVHTLRSLFLLLFLVLCFSLQAQNFADKDYYLIDSLVLENLNEHDKKLIDSNLKIFHSSKIDTIQLNALNTLIEEYWDHDVWPRYNDYLLYHSQKIINNTSNNAIRKAAYSFEGCAHLNTALLFRLRGPNEKVKEYYKLGIKSFEKCGDKQRLGLALMGLATFHSEAGEFLQSIDLGEKAIELLKGTENKQSTLSCYHNMSIIQHNVGNKKEAEYYSRLTYTLALEQNDERMQSECLHDFVVFNVREGNFKQALDTAFLALKSAEKLNNPFYVLRSYHRIAEVYVRLSKLDEALVWIQKTDSINQIIKSIEFETKSDQLKLDVFIDKGEYKKAEEAGMSALKVAQESNMILAQIAILERLAKVANVNGQANLAAEYLFNLLALQDKTAKDEGAKLGIKQVIEYNYEKQKEIDDLKNEQKLELAEQQKQKTRIALFSVTIIVLLIGLLTLFIFNKLRVIRKQKIELDTAYGRLEESKKNELAVSNLKAIRSQMNPHFIFNSLNSIQALVLKKDSKKSYDYIEMFSNLVRKTLQFSEKNYVRLAEEISFLDIYLNLESLRMKTEFTYLLKNNIEEEVSIPTLLIQPFLENAIHHGLLHKEGKKELLITFELIDKKASCTIIDNGIGRTKATEIKARQKYNHESFSLNATEERLRILSEQNDQIYNYSIEDLESQDGSALGTKVMVYFPFKNNY